MNEAELRARADISVYGLLERESAAWPDFCALHYMGRSVSFAEMLHAADRCAASLSVSGVRKGDCIVVCLPNIPEAVILIYGANKLGAVCRMLHPLSSPAEARESVDSTGAQIVFSLDEFRGLFRGAAYTTLVTVSPADWLNPGVRLLRRLCKPAPRTTGRVVSWHAFMRAGARSGGEITDAGSGSDPAFILSSGGTSGTPKSIELSNLSVNALALQVQTFDSVPGVNNTALCLMPVFHGFGLALNLMAALIAGKRCVLLPRYSPRSFARTIRSQRPNYIAGVPILYEKMAANPYLRGADLSFLTLLLCGGDTMSEKAYARVNEFLAGHGCKVTLRMGYGLTECVSACSFLSEGAYAAGCIGYPLPGMEMIIWDEARGAEAPAGEPGEICVTGPTLMTGYAGDPEATAQALRTHPDGRVWLHTGDLGRIGTGGAIYFCGRIKNVIKSSGYNVFPAQIEEVLASHRAVEAAAVAGVSEDDGTVRIIAFVKPAGDMKKASGAGLEADLAELCAKNLSKWSLPHKIIFVESMPLTRMKKIDTEQLVISMYR